MAEVVLAPRSAVWAMRSSVTLGIVSGGHDARAAGTAGAGIAGIARVDQARATSMATGTGLLTMSRTGE
jgi:hypothetical protein